MLVCPDKKVPTRVGFMIDGSKSRLSKKSSKKIKIQTKMISIIKNSLMYNQSLDKLDE